MYLNQLRLGQSAFRSDALHKIYSWAPSKARSYTIERIERYEYGVFKIRRRYFTVTVTYYSRADEGSYRFGDWSWKRYCLGHERFPVLRVVKRSVPEPSVARRIVMGESTSHPDKFRRGERVEV
jgi:hypothetical protein